MENTQIQPPTTPSTPENAVSPIVTPPPTQPQKPKFPLWVGLIIIVILIIISLLAGYYSSKRYQDGITTPGNTIASPTIAPITNQGNNPIATTSAFLQIEASVASLSARIAEYNPTDPQIAPPVLDLPLGFSN
jgi:hypothetical protein